MARILILYNDDAGLAHGEALDEVATRAVIEQVRDVEAACRAAGHEVQRAAAPARPRELLGLLEETRPELVFNLVESLRGEARLEAAVAWLFELEGLSYTGSPAPALSLALDKPLTNGLLRGQGLPVPRGQVLRRGDEPLAQLSPPLIVKPTREDASHGITLESVVADAAAARARARYILERYGQPALVEEFAEGRELNVSVLGEGESARSLLLAEIDYSGFPAGKPHLITYAAKWEEQSAECLGSNPMPARDLAPELAARISELAVGAYRAVGLRDYGRVDLRLHPERGPLILDVNANPDLSEKAGLARAARWSGLRYDQLIEQIVQAALRRRAA
jgi:D-alanine-D-alanine ligase